MEIALSIACGLFILCRLFGQTDFIVANAFNFKPTNETCTTMNPDENVLKKYRQAGKIAREVREEVTGIVHEGMPIIELCEKTELLVKKKGGKPAFPCNVSVNEVAAHYTSPPNDKHVIAEKALVKIDIGVHVDGYIADTAVSVCFNPGYEGLVTAAEDALGKAVRFIQAGMSTSKFGAYVQQTIQNHGFKPVSNLTGHEIGRYLIHAGKSLPNVSHFFGARILEGAIFAIEPFVTLPNAAGKVENGEEAHIFRFMKRKSLNNPHAKQLLQFVEKNFVTLPFAKRWLQKVLPQNHFEDAFKELLLSRCVMAYPVFVEASGMPVAQAEHTVLITRNGCEVLT